MAPWAHMSDKQRASLELMAADCFSEAAHLRAMERVTSPDLARQARARRFENLGEILCDIRMGNLLLQRVTQRQGEAA